MHDKVAKEIQNKHYFISSLKEIGHKFTDLLPQHYQQFSDSWGHLDSDLYMSDKGKYRYRRYSVINWRNNDDLEYLPPEPHFQKKTYNYLHGDIYRHYSPFEDKTLKNPLLKALIDYSGKAFCQLKKEQQSWRVECHQFRIVPSKEEKGLPTPEGKHRDGVEYVFMMLINRHNIEGGVILLQ